MAPARPVPSYDKDEKVFCFHGPLLYEAKVLNVEPKDPKDKKSDFKYYVHYKGWKNSWDDWVNEDRLKKINEESRELEKSLKKDHLRKQREADAAKRDLKAASKRRSGLGVASSDKASGRGSEERSMSVQAPPTGRGTKRSRELFEIEKEENFQNRPSVRILLPDLIKSLLVDDWENVTKNQTLVPLPHQHSISDILNDYVRQSKRRAGSADADILEEVVQGLHEYFNRCIGRILLYRFERQQWAEMHDRMAGKRPAGVSKSDPDLTGKSPVDIYGAEHFSRLLVSMPELIAQTNMDAPSVSRLREELQSLAGWLGKNADKYFSASYESVGADYLAKNKQLG